MRPSRSRSRPGTTCSCSPTRRSTSPILRSRSSRASPVTSNPGASPRPGSTPRSSGSTASRLATPSSEHDTSWQESAYRGAMRASRLVTVLLLLQSRGQLTAGELAAELEVSERTIHRDVDALSASGVPVYAERGPHGGIRLVDGYRTRLTGLTGDEAEALFLAGIPGPAAELGLGTVVAAAQLKVLASLPAELRTRASRLVERFHLDAGEWFATSQPVPYLGLLSDAVWNATRIAVDYRREGVVTPRLLEPLGLVLKAGVWYI